MRSPFISLASFINCEITLVCSSHPGNPGTPPFCTDVSTYSLSTMYDVILLASTAKKILPSTLRSEIVQNCLISAEFSSFGTKQPSATCQCVGMWPFLQMTLINFHSRLRSLGHFMYTLYVTPFGPGADPARAFFATSFTSFSVGSLVSKGLSGGGTTSILLFYPRGSSLDSSECVSLS